MKRLELFMERWYAWFIYSLPFGIIISLFFLAVDELNNLPSFFAVVCFGAAHDSLYCWKHGNHIVPTIDPLWVYYKRRGKEDYYEKHYLILGVVATIIGIPSFGVSVVIFILNLLSL